MSFPFSNFLTPSLLLSPHLSLEYLPKLPFFVPPSLSLWDDVIYEWSLSGNTGFYLLIMAIRSSGVCWQNNIIWAKNDHATAGVEWLGRGLLKINPKIIKKPASFRSIIITSKLQVARCAVFTPIWQILTLCCWKKL